MCAPVPDDIDIDPTNRIGRLRRDRLFEWVVILTPIWSAGLLWLVGRLLGQW